MAKSDDDGHITTPKAVSDAGGRAAGDRVVVEARDAEVVIRLARGVLEFEPPQSEREAPAWPNARRAARDERSAARAERGQR